MTFTDLAKSYVRTIVPLVVGGIVAWALHHGHDISGYEGLVTVLVTAGYYGLARLLEHYVSPQFGWLLGLAQTPLYGAVGHLKASAGTVGHHTVQIHADTTQAVAALKEVTAAAKEASKAVASVKPPKKVAPVAKDAGLTLIEVVVIFTLVLVVLLIVGVIR